MHADRTRSFVLSTSLWVVACSPAPAPSPLPQPIAVAPVASSAAPPPSVSPAPPPSAEPSFTLPLPPRLRATVTMKMDGSLRAEKLRTAINRQIHPMAGCVSLLRKTDQVTGSLNLQIAVNDAGVVTAELQSPANADATKCILSGAKAWTLPNLGAGRAMVLLNVDEGIPRDPRTCTRDDECTIGTLQGCCGCGEPASPRAVHKASIQARDRMCSNVDCKVCEPTTDPSPEREPTPKSAVCRASHCEGVY